MKILVIAEHDNHQLKPATLNAVAAASQLSSEVTLLVAGLDCSTVVEEATKVCGVTEILHAEGSADNTHWLAEPLSRLIVSVVRASNFNYVIAAATSFGKNCLPRVAALLDVAQLSDVTAILSADTFVRPIYAGNAFVTVKSNDGIKVISVRGTAFSASEVNKENQQAVKITQITEQFADPRSRFICHMLNISERPELTTARVIISGGRGLQSGENFKMLEALADVLNAALGASRAAVDAGFVPNDFQVGQTGKVVAPDLYIAIGISGAIQHIAGMKDSKIIVAINKDPEAPIFQIADYGLVGDLFTIVPELTAALVK